MKTLQARFTRSQLRLMFSGWKTSLDVKGSFDTCSHVMLKAVGQALFSSGLQNPKFTAEEKKGEDYEIRTYHATKWVSTSLSGMQLDAAMNTGFRRLFRYIQGNNQNKVKVEMTAPVTCRVDPGAGPACESHFTVSFYIPEEHQASPPEPSDPEVFVENRKEFTAYIRTYGGFSNENMKREELLKLLESLQRDVVPYVDKPFYTVGYDSPFKLTNRRNEVWVLKKEHEQ
ncbi:heme-binding protein 2-like [Seriola lalandi dorsalis]|uniref:Heme binding protein 2 n=1 Tax=Seriola lalandi dorsalis TaxID=1841481 RepID=A0A3B4X4M9_SERLL|nr:heme-binding protein 2-like [Seriola lalandi dorsalis]XP_056261726.1 heme-binding protein 2 isoform X1 [Seriola aureovittata]